MIDTSKIREHAEVVGNDGIHVGTVDHLDGENQIKLTRNDPAAGGQHHFVSLDDVDTVDEEGRVVLKANGEDVKRVWATP